MRRKSPEGRSNALWGRGGRTETRGNALWGRGGRAAGAMLAVVCAALVTAASATAGKPAARTYVPDSAAWSDAAWSDAAVADGADVDTPVGSDATAISPTDQSTVEESLGIADSSDTTSTTP